jgi:hypothetical protein
VNRFVVAAALVGCSVPDLDLTGKPCPCPDGWVCSAANTCQRTVAPGDALRDTPPDHTNMDTPVAASCLVAPYTAPIYTTTTFGDFNTAQWIRPSGAGTWSVIQGQLHQTDNLSSLAYVYHMGVLTNFRVVATMHQEMGDAGGAVEIAFRISTTSASMYHCNFEPNDGGFLIQETANGVGGTQLVTKTLQGVNPQGTYTMEVQATDHQLQCCIDGIPDAYLTIADSTYGAGYAGLKTYVMSAVISAFTVYQ